MFHGVRHPRELGRADAGRFLEHLAQSEKDPLRSLELAREALTFLYEECLHLPLGELPFPKPPRLLDRLRGALRLRHRSPRTEQCYVDWAVRSIRFHGMRHPNTMGSAEIEMFLTDLAVNGHVSASTQNQAFNALLFLFRDFQGIELPRLDAVRAAAEAAARLCRGLAGNQIIPAGQRSGAAESVPLLRGRVSDRQFTCLRLGGWH